MNLVTITTFKSSGNSLSGALMWSMDATRRMWSIWASRESTSWLLLDCSMGPSKLWMMIKSSLHNSSSIISRHSNIPAGRSDSSSRSSAIESTICRKILHMVQIVSYGQQFTVNRCVCVCVCVCAHVRMHMHTVINLDCLILRTKALQSFKISQHHRRLELLQRVMH